MIIKREPEDFIVKEINHLDISGGSYSYYLLKKIRLTTPDAIKLISRRLKIDEKNINYAGNKDKDAITEQYISILNGPKTNINSDSIGKNSERGNDVEGYGGKYGERYEEKYELSFIGRGNERLTLGSLEGNYFEIIVREVSDDFDNVSDNHYSVPQVFVNYFDDQRFGRDNKNHILGKMLVKKQFREFCSTLCIEVFNNDYVGAIKKNFDRRKLLLFIHAYQSYLFNETADKYLETFEKVNFRKIMYGLGKLNIPKENISKKISKIKIPIVGFGTELKNICKDKKDKTSKDGYEKDEYEIYTILKQLLEKEGIKSPREFIIPQLNGLTVEGDFRDLVMNVKNLKIEKAGINAYKCTFTLPKGSYATIVMKSIFLYM